MKWAAWRGTPQLVAHVADAAVRASDRAGSHPAACQIMVVVGDDQEIFESPKQFTESVTPEGLRDFRQISISVGETSDVAINVTFERDLTMTHFPLVPNSAGVLLRVTITAAGKPDPAMDVAAAAKVSEATYAVAPAIDRGRGRLVPRALEGSADEALPDSGGSNLILEDIVVFAAVLVSATVVAMVVFGLVVYLLHGGSAWKRITDSRQHTGLEWAVVLVAAVAVMAAFSRRLRPRVEVAPLGQTRLWRVVKYVGATIAALAVSALSKKYLGAN